MATKRKHRRRRFPLPLLHRDETIRHCRFLKGKRYKACIKAKPKKRRR